MLGSLAGTQQGWRVQQGWHRVEQHRCVCREPDTAPHPPGPSAHGTGSSHGSIWFNNFHLSTTGEDTAGFTLASA